MKLYLIEYDPDDDNWCDMEECGATDAIFYVSKTEIKICPRKIRKKYFDNTAHKVVVQLLGEAAANIKPGIFRIFTIPDL